MTDAPKLNPCPFCGGEACIDGTSWRPTDGKEVAWVTCSKCNAFGPTDTAEIAISDWNTRATPPEVTALVEALRIANVHVANNAQGWSVARSAAKADQAIIEAALAKWEAANG